MSGARFLPVEIRFWSWVNKTDTCWLWIGCTDYKGYGRFKIDDKTFLSHRLAWEFLVGPISSGLFVCHSCDTPGCVNPSHLYLGTNQDNMDDMSKKHRSRHSKITEEQVREIRASTYTQRQIAKQYGLCQASVRDIRNGSHYRFVV